MPPKAKKNEPSKKTEQKKKDKVVEDKTFGLKNKKGAKQQKFIQQVEKQVKFGNQKTSKLATETEKERTKKKDDKQRELDELNALFRPVQSVTRGVDPKSVLCAFYKQGQCTKGDKCKFSHDLNISRKGEKKSVYDDVRNEDTMENWDEAKLEDVINKKHGEAELSKPKTAIICKFFLEAVENNKYGWFWSCPNGGNKCMYRHALPAGFVLKKDQKKEDKKDEISLEELIEKERAALGFETTRVTLESFLKWKARKKQEKIATMVEENEKKKNDFKQGKLLGISGRQMFEFNPDLMNEDDEEAEAFDIERELEDEEDDTRVVDINLEMLSAGAKEVDGTGTQMTIEARKQLAERLKSNDVVKNDDEAEKLDMAGALPTMENNTAKDGTNTTSTAAVNGDVVADVPIDEDLFAGDDIDFLDDDLDNLDVED
ncbi:zinc finger CCCH domain-containing protein 15-like [Gigantopelta aegis]|uniref:zinc finger CCCH domain-containing protein 15-like n=1 Tax=Gigantopelta aegis TaxID=1735272 RepID=UPI001B88D2C9|nr:zinc finger CCCH domain-containing protein 15-like [Gigantopelta aegis]